MRLEANAGELANALGMAALATTDIAKKIQILGAVHIVADTRVRLTANALGRCISCAVAATIEHHGEAAVSAETLAKLVAGFGPDATVALALSDAKLTVRCNRSNYKLATLPIEDLPEIPTVDVELGKIEIERDMMLRLLARPLFCIASELTRYYLCGLYLHHHPADGKVATVATDGTRLCRVAAPAAGRLSDDRTLIIPTESVKPLIKILTRGGKKSAGPITLRRSRTLVEIAAADFTFVSKLIDANYPAYERLLPEGEMPNSATLRRTELAQALERLAAVADRKPKIIPLLGMTWDAGSADVRLSLLRQPGMAAESLNAEPAGSARVAVALGKMIELTDELAGEKIKIEADGMGALRVVTPGDGDMMILQMPMQWPADAVVAA